MAGINGGKRLRHTERQLQALPHGDRPLQRGVGRRADAVFDLLHPDRPRHPRHLRAAQSWSCSVAWLRAAVGEERRYAVEAGEAREDGQYQRRAKRRDPRCRTDGA